MLELISVSLNIPVKNSLIGKEITYFEPAEVQYSNCSLPPEYGFTRPAPLFNLSGLPE